MSPRSHGLKRTDLSFYLENLWIFCQMEDGRRLTAESAATAAAVMLVVLFFSPCVVFLCKFCYFADFACHSMVSNAPANALDLVEDLT